MDTTFNSKDLIKKLVKEQHFNSTADVMNCNERNDDGLEERIVSLYATGMSLNDIKN